MSSITIRPIHNSDAGQLQSAFEHLSQGSRYFRFHAPLRRIPDALLRYLTHVDGIDHVALVAIERSDSEPAHGVGVARFVRNHENPQSAELAITLTDEAQGRGLARRLLDALGSAAHERGIERFSMIVLSDNQHARQVLAHLGAVASGSDGPVIHFILPVARLLSNAA